MAVRFPMSPGKTIKVVAAKCALSLLVVVVVVARAPFDFDIEINTSADRSEGKTSGSYSDRNFLLTFSFWKKVEKKGKKKKKAGRRSMTRSSTASFPPAKANGKRMAEEAKANADRLHHSSPSS